MSDPGLFQKITVTSTTFASKANPDVYVPFLSTGISLLNEDSASVVEVSFDGTTLHDELNPNLPSKGTVYDNRFVSAVWFRLKSGTSAVVSIRVW